jgi:hypothetical protein
VFTLVARVICQDCFGHDVFCKACGGSGVRYCCEGRVLEPIEVEDGIATYAAHTFVVNPDWCKETYPIVHAEDEEPRDVE